MKNTLDLSSVKDITDSTNPVMLTPSFGKYNSPDVVSPKTFNSMWILEISSGTDYSFRLAFFHIVQNIEYYSPGFEDGTENINEIVVATYNGDNPCAPNMACFWSKVNVENLEAIFGTDRFREWFEIYNTSYEVLCQTVKKYCPKKPGVIWTHEGLKSC